MEIRRDVFQAIADPTRREIIRLLSKNNLNLNAIAGNFDQARPTISQHIKILEECGLITITQYGRERFCEARLQQLDEVESWVNEARKLWSSRFHSLEKFLDDTHSEKKSTRKKKHGNRN